MTGLETGLLIGGIATNLTWLFKVLNQSQDKENLKECISKEMKTFKTLENKYLRLKDEKFWLKEEIDILKAKVQIRDDIIKSMDSNYKFEILSKTTSGIGTTLQVMETTTKEAFDILVPNNILQDKSAIKSRLIKKMHSIKNEIKVNEVI